MVILHPNNSARISYISAKFCMGRKCPLSIVNSIYLNQSSQVSFCWSELKNLHKTNLSMRKICAENFSVLMQILKRPQNLTKQQQMTALLNYNLEQPEV